jgi:hypothetical protein
MRGEVKRQHAPDHQHIAKPSTDDRLRHAACPRVQLIRTLDDGKGRAQDTMLRVALMRPCFGRGCEQQGCSAGIEPNDAIGGIKQVSRYRACVTSSRGSAVLVVQTAKPVLRTASPLATGHT